MEVSETVTIITSLTDPAAYPARDIAELYGMRWASELVYLEEKQTLSAGQPLTAATPAGAYRMAAATVAVHQALRIARAAVAAAIAAEPARISATALRDTATASIRAGQGATVTVLTAAIGIISRDITRHPLRFVTAWAARTALPPVHHQESPGPAKAATPSRPRPGCTCSRCPSPRRPRSRTRRQQPDTRPRHPGPAPPRRDAVMPPLPETPAGTRLTANRSLSRPAGTNQTHEK